MQILKKYLQYKRKSVIIFMLFLKMDLGEKIILKQMDYITLKKVII